VAKTVFDGAGPDQLHFWFLSHANCSVMNTRFACLSRQARQLHPLAKRMPCTEIHIGARCVWAGQNCLYFTQPSARRRALNGVQYFVHVGTKHKSKYLKYILHEVYTTISVLCRLCGPRTDIKVYLHAVTRWQAARARHAKGWRWWSYCDSGVEGTPHSGWHSAAGGAWPVCQT
jgi:hypothetical protein